MYVILNFFSGLDLISADPDVDQVVGSGELRKLGNHILEVEVVVGEDVRQINDLQSRSLSPSSGLDSVNELANLLCGDWSLGEGEVLEVGDVLGADLDHRGEASVEVLMVDFESELLELGRGEQTGQDVLVEPFLRYLFKSDQVKVFKLVSRQLL